MTEPGLADAAAEVLAYWRRAGDNGDWFGKRPAFDRDFGQRFLALHEAAAAGALDAWALQPDSALALLVLLDQYPRNAFRGTPRMYATDEAARRIARQALQAGHFERLEPALRLFMCLPFAHSENPADQDRSVQLNSRLGPEARSHAEGHRSIVRRFGRFPHRNALLGRVSTLEELAFLRDGGFAG